MAQQNSPLTSLFQDLPDELVEQLSTRQKKIMSASRVGSPGKITTLMGYSGNTKLNTDDD